MPLAILEGPDGAGKTTLAQRLLKGTGQPTLLVKRSSPPGEVETLGFQASWIQSQSQAGLNIIADRHPLISETLYAPTVRGVDPGYGPGEVLEKFAEMPPWSRPLIIYCRAPFARMAEASRVEVQMEGVHDKYRDLVLVYDDFMAKLARRDIEILRYDFTEDPDASRVIDRVTQLFQGD